MTKTFSLYTQKCPFWATDLSIWKKIHLECLQSMMLHYMPLPRGAKWHHCWLNFSNSNSAYHASVIFHPFCIWFGSISHMRSYKWIPCKFPAFFSFRIQSTANLWPNIAQMQIAWPVTVTFTHTHPRSGNAVSSYLYVYQTIGWCPKHDLYIARTAVMTRVILEWNAWFFGLLLICRKCFVTIFFLLFQCITSHWDLKFCLCVLSCFG